MFFITRPTDHQEYGECFWFPPAARFTVAFKKTKPKHISCRVQQHSSVRELTAARACWLTPGCAVVLAVMTNPVRISLFLFVHWDSQSITSYNEIKRSECDTMLRWQYERALEPFWMINVTAAIFMEIFNPFFWSRYPVRAVAYPSMHLAESRVILPTRRLGHSFKHWAVAGSNWLNVIHCINWVHFDSWGLERD